MTLTTIQGPTLIPTAASSNKRLLIVSYALSGGGAERFTSTLLAGLNRDLFEPVLCLVKPDISYPLPDDVPVYTLEKTRPWHWPRAVTSLRKLILQIRPDIVLSTISYTAQLAGLSLLGIRHRPRWVIRLGNDPASDGNWWKKRLNSVVYRRSDIIAANSQGLARAIGQHYPSITHQITHLANPTDFIRIERLAQEIPADMPSVSEPIIISVGRLTRQKRQDILLKAFARVRKNEPARLWFLGTGPLDTVLREHAAGLGVLDHIDFLGFKPNPYPYMARADIFALTSDYEGSPNALIEAQGLGIPSVATRCPYGPDEIIHDRDTGILVSVGDFNMIAREIEWLLKNKEKRKAMGVSARLHARNAFDLNTAVRRWENILMQENSVMGF